MNKSLKIHKFKSGDIGFSASNTFVSRAIRFFTSMHTGEATYSHSFALIDENLIVESLDRIRIKPLQKYDKDNQSISIYRIPLDDVERKKFRDGMILMENGHYGWFKIPLFALDAVTTGIKRLFGSNSPSFFFTRKFAITSIPVCSQLVVFGLHKFTNYRIVDCQRNVINWRDASPDYLQDLLKLEDNQAELLYTGKVI